LKPFSELLAQETAKLDAECIIETAADIINSIEFVMAIGRRVLNMEKMNNVIIYQKMISSFYEHERVYREAGKQPLFLPDYFRKFVEIREDAARYLANMKLAVKLIDLLPPDLVDSRAQWLMAAKECPMFNVIRQAIAMEEELQEQDALYIKFHAEHGLEA
jgi:hypothetical protein